MKIKDALFSLAIGYIATTIPIWESGAALWVIWLMAAVICWDVIIRVDEFLAKKKSARGAATPGRAHKKLISSKL